MDNNNKDNDQENNEHSDNSVLDNILKHIHSRKYKRISFCLEKFNHRPRGAGNSKRVQSRIKNSSILKKKYFMVEIQFNVP